VRVIAHIEREAAMSTRQKLLATFDRFAARCGNAVPTEALSAIRGGLLRARHLGAGRPSTEERASAMYHDRRRRQPLEFCWNESRNCAVLDAILRTRALTARLNRQRTLRVLARYREALERRAEHIRARHTREVER